MTTLDPRSIDLRERLKARIESWTGPSPGAAQARYRTAAAAGSPRRLAAGALALAMVGAMGGVAVAYQGLTLPFTQIHLGAGGGGSGGPRGNPTVTQPAISSAAAPTCATNSRICLATPDQDHANTGPPGQGPAVAPASPAQPATPTADPSPGECQPGIGQGAGDGKNHPKGVPPPRCH